ncbi:MAG TPA: hypothetical protein VGL61_23495 [Kofleriaceae bacterium]|jgi:hypothetical protein
MIFDLLAGALLVNALPHLISGLQGRAFPSPFAKPPGRGNSSAVVNVVWGFANVFGGLALLAYRPVGLAFTPEAAMVALGGVLIGVPLAYHFGKVRSETAER